MWVYPDRGTQGERKRSCCWLLWRLVVLFPRVVDAAVAPLVAVFLVYAAVVLVFAMAEFQFQDWSIFLENMLKFCLQLYTNIILRLARMAGDSWWISKWDAETIHIQPVDGIGSHLVQPRCATGELMQEHSFITCYVFFNMSTFT